MFVKTYRTTLKTIVRSPLTWGALALVLAFGIYRTSLMHYAMVDLKTLGQIWDTDPRFTPSLNIYRKEVLNCPLTTLMLVPIPVFSVIVSGVVMIRDWRDSFFEVDRAGGVGPARYFFGRFLAAFSFVTVAALIMDFLFFHAYFITRGMVDGMSVGEYVADSTVRLLRTFFTAVLPGILTYVSAAFLAGNLLHSGVAGMMTGLSYVAFGLAEKTFLRSRLPEIYLNYFTPVPKNLYLYWASYGFEEFNHRLTNPFTTREMITCLCCLYGVSAVCLTVSYLCVRKRRT